MFSKTVDILGRILKSGLLLSFIFVITYNLPAQPRHQMEPGIWGGGLVYQNQSTPFYLEFTDNGSGELTAYSYMPVIPFPKRSLGTVITEDSLFTAGTVRFKMDARGEKLTGSFPGSSRNLQFELSPIAKLPTTREPVSSRSTATPLWTFKTNGAIWGGISADHEQIYTGSSDGRLYSLAQSSGELKWSFQTDGAIFSKPLISDGKVYILSDDGFLYKLDAETGTLYWRFDTGGQKWLRKLPNDIEPGYDSMASAPVISGGVVYAGSADGHLYAIDDSSGTVKWRFKTDGPVHSIPAVADGMVFFGSYDHHVYALAASNGLLSWSFDTGQVVVSSPVYSNGKVIIGSRSADLYALNAKNGREVWRYYHWGSWVESSGTIFDGRLYIGSSDDQLLKSFDPENGNLLWSLNLGGSPWTTPAVTQNTVYSGTFGNANYGIDHKGGFFAVDRLTGNEKWRYMWNKTPATDMYGVVSSPVVANRRVFFGGLDGVVYGFETGK